jgi:hypothetical protein
VLAFPSTSALAQAAAAPPVIEVAPPSAPVAPAPVASVPVPSAPVLVLPTEQAARPVEPAAPVASQRAEPARAVTPRAVQAAPAQSVAVERTAPAPVAAPVSAGVEPMPAAPDRTITATDAAAPVANTAPAARDAGLSTLELGLIGGAVAVGGIGLVALMARRRRPDPRDPQANEPIVVADNYPPVRAAEPVVVPEPTVAPSTPQVARARAAPIAFRPVSAATAGDHRIGQHEAMVDAGPTADNPFLTRAKRLRRARFLDKQEALTARRRAGEGVMRAGTVTASQRQGDLSQPASRRGNAGW